MIVLDASALIELLVGTVLGERVARRLAEPSIDLHVPHLADVEVAQALRRLERTGELDEEGAEQAIHLFRQMDVERHAHEPLLVRVWDLRENLSAYDAVYVALAEALDARLLTCDARLARAPGMMRRIELVA